MRQRVWMSSQAVCKKCASLDNKRVLACSRCLSLADSVDKKVPCEIAKKCPVDQGVELCGKHASELRQLEASDGRFK